MPTLHIHLLGDFRLVYDDTLVTTVVQARLQALLAYLLLHRDSPQPRQRLAFLFWPDTAESQALTNLRQLLHYLRQNLPAAGQFLQVETKTVQWRLDAAYTLDVADFEHDLTQAAAAAQEGHPASERAALESAVQRYGGDLLPGCYDDWILPERERLRQAYFGALERLILLAEDQRDYRSAIGHAESLLRHDPLHETTYRRLIRLRALNGERASALRVYHTCVTVLERELGVEPNVDTQEAYRRLLAMETPVVLRARPPAVSGARPALVGRHDEWMMLRSAWRRTAVGHPAFVLISGEAGIGKTRLAEEFLEWAAQQGMRTARARFYAAEGQLAYAPVTELLRADPLRTRLSRLDDVWLTEVTRLLPELLVERRDLPEPKPITDSWQRKRLFEALARAVLGDKGPLLLLIEDMQWCDHDTLEWLHYLLHFDAEAKLLIIGAVRPEEVDQAHPLTPLVLDLRNREHLTEIELGPLDADETARLAEQMTGRKLDADQASRLYLYTEGNPLFVVETIRSEVSVGETVWRIGGTEADHALVLPDPAAPQRPPSSTNLPPKVHAVIQARLRQLSPSTRELASLAATIGRAFTSDVLARASESDEGTLVRGLDELWRRRIIREQGITAYDFSHDRIREVAYAEVSAARRQALHQRVATALEQAHAANLDAVSGQIAVHYEQAGRAEQAIAYYQRAARVAQQTFSNAEVCNLLARALSLLPMLPDTLARTQTELTMLIALATALMSSKGYGHPEVEQTLLRAWDLCRTLGRPAQTIPVLAGLWVCYHLKGDLAQATAWAEHLEREVRTTSNSQFHAIAHFTLAGTALFRGDFLAARQYAEQGLAGFDPGQHGPQSILFGYEPGIAIVPYQALSLWLLGYPDQARKHIQRALALASQFAQPATIAFTLSMATVLHQWRGEVSLTLDQAAATIDYAIEKGMPQWIAHGQMLQGWALAHQGQVDKGVDQLRNGLAAWQAMGGRLALTYYLLLLAETLTISGQLDEGLNVVAEALTIIREGGEPWFEAELYRRQGELLLARGADGQEIEAPFQRALEIARLRHARSLELRAAMSLSRLWQQQGKHAVACQGLTEIYRSFSEGVDTADVRKAEALLHALA